MPLSHEPSSGVAAGDLSTQLLTLVALLARDVHQAGQLSDATRRTIHMILSEVRDDEAAAAQHQVAIRIFDEIEPIGDG